MSDTQQPDMAIGQNNHVSAKFVNENGTPYTNATITVELVDDVKLEPVEGTKTNPLTHSGSGVYQGVMKIPDGVPPGAYRRHYTGETSGEKPISLMTRRITVSHGVVGVLED